MNCYGASNNKWFEYSFVVIDNFSKFGRTSPLKNKHAQAVTDSFSQIIKTSKGKPNIVQPDDCKEYVK